MLIPGLGLSADKLYPESKRMKSRPLRIRFNDVKRTITRFDHYLHDVQMTSVIIDEKLLRDFDVFMLKLGVNDIEVRVHRHNICRLINLLPDDVLQRPLVTLAECDRLNRFAGLVKSTQEGFEHFLKHGRKLKKGTTHQRPEYSSELLSEQFRKTIVDQTMTFMRQIQANDVSTLTEDDVEEFVDYYDNHGNKVTAENLLGYIRPLFTHLRHRGIIKADILSSIPRKKSSINRDYVEQAGMDKLADLSKLNMDDFKVVRGRLLAFVLDYNFALRNRESSLVCCGDFRGVKLYLPKWIQKVQKDTLPLFNYFPQVVDILMKRYLELRAMKHPDTDVLVIGCDGKPLGPDGCRAAVKEHCSKLHILTHENKDVTPHRLRHSFGTLNIEPSGLGLSIVEISEQLRHSSLQLSYDVYITKNEVRKDHGYEKRMAMVNARDLTRPVAVHSEPAVDVQVMTLDEMEALRRLQNFGLNYRALRDYAMKAGKTHKNGRGYVYSAEFITELTAQYVTSDVAIRIAGLARSTFFERTKKTPVDTITIGRATLYRTENIIEWLRSA